MILDKFPVTMKILQYFDLSNFLFEYILALGVKGEKELLQLLWIIHSE